MLGGIIAAPSGGGSNPNVNPDTATERFGGSASTGYGTEATSGASAHGKGNWTQLMSGYAGSVDGAAVNDIAEISVILTQANTGSPASSARFSIDIGIGPDSSNVTIIVPNMTLQPGSAGMKSLRFPRNFPAGTKVWVRGSSSGAAVVFAVTVTGIIADGTVYPGFNLCEKLYPGATPATPHALTIPNTLDVQLVPTVNTGWTTYRDPLDNDVGALVVNFGQKAATGYPTVANNYTAVRIGWGAGGSTGTPPNIVWAQRTFIMNATPLWLPPEPIFIRAAIPAGSRLAIELVSDKAVTAADLIQPEIWALRNV